MGELHLEIIVDRLRREALQVVFFEAQAEHDAAHGGAERIAAERLVAFPRTAGGVELRLRRCVSERPFQLMHAALGIQKLLLAGYDLIEDRRLPHLDGFLTQIADACTVCKHDLAFIRLFGATGGVMEAALRTAHHIVTGRAPEEDMFERVRGLEGWKEATFDLAGTSVRVAVASGLANAKRLCDAVLAGRASYDFVEVMACPGGCVGGGGQPIREGEERAGERGQVLYGLDKIAQYRNSYENPSIVRCYEEYFGAPMSKRAEELLHTDQHAWQMPGERGLGPLG